MSTSHLLALADSLTDRLARLDELFAKAGPRGSAGLAPLLQALSDQAADATAQLLGAARTAASDRLATALPAGAETLRHLHARLDLVPGTEVPAETDWLLLDWLGAYGEGRVAPPVLPSLVPHVHGTFLPGSTLCGLYLPVAERENPLAWTLLAQPLGRWLAGAPDTTWSTTRLADHLALRLTGPAFAFALAYAEPDRWFTAHAGEPGLLRRLRWSLADVAAAGFDHPQLTALAGFADAMATLVPDDAAPAGWTDGAPVVGEVLAGLPTFTPADFATAAAMVADLRQGLPISARPRRSRADQQQALAHFKAQDGFRPGTALDLLALLRDDANPAATILNAGWLYRNELRAGWLDELREMPDGVAALRHARLRGTHLDQLLQKSLETATIHRLLQEARA